MGNVSVVVPQNSAYIAEFSKKAPTLLKTGRNWINPLTTTIAHRLSLKEAMIDLDQTTLRDKKSIPIIVKGVLFLKITDPIKYAYEATKPDKFAVTLTKAYMRRLFAQYDYEEVLGMKDDFQKDIIEKINESTQRWGLQCQRLTLKELELHPDYKKIQDYNQQFEVQKQSDFDRLEELSIYYLSKVDEFKKIQELGAELQISELEQKTKEMISMIPKLQQEFSDKNLAVAAKLLLKNLYTETVKTMMSSNKNINIPFSYDDVEKLFEEEKQTK
jgi:regulator of protease activity HflC (stomatin/prohibitin superfamily)